MYNGVVVLLVFVCSMVSNVFCPDNFNGIVVGIILSCNRSIHIHIDFDLVLCVY